MTRGCAFAAIDFETADREPDSACAVGLVRVENRRIVAREYCLIRPPRRRFVYSKLHGISWEDVRDQPAFREIWPRFEVFLDGIEFVAAHNARFDRRVLFACCRKAGIAVPPYRFECTVSIARRTWRFFPTSLPCVCRELGIRLDHHHAMSDAEACARIVMEAQCCGWTGLSSSSGHNPSSGGRKHGAS